MLRTSLFSTKGDFNATADLGCHDFFVRRTITTKLSMWLNGVGLVIALLLGVVGISSAQAATTTINFDNIPNHTFLTDQYQTLGVNANGVLVVNAWVTNWTPHSAPNLAFSPSTDGMNFDFTPAATGNIRTVSVYMWCYLATELLAYDAANNLVGQAVLQPGNPIHEFDNQPGRLLSITSTGNPITRVVIQGDPSYYAIDDLSFSTGPTNFGATALGLGGRVGGVLQQGINATGQVAGFSATTSSASHAFAYLGTSTQDLGTLGGRISAANAISASGQVVGSSETGRRQIHAFSWTQAGGMVDVGTLGGNSSAATSTNATGQVVGTAQTRQGKPHAFLWSSGGMMDLGTLGGNTSSAAAINAAGQVIGAAELRSGKTHAFSWQPATGIVDLGTLGGNNSSASGLNTSGQVTGSAQTASGQMHAFSWTAAGGMVDLGTLGGKASAAIGINNSGQVTGSAQTASGQWHAFSWTAAGGMVDLGTFGGKASGAIGVNTSSQVVGTAQTSSGEWRAFAWTPADGLVDLNTRIPGAPAGMKLYSALAVSDNGSIAALSGSGVVLLTPGP